MKKGNDETILTFCINNKYVIIIEQFGLPRQEYWDAKICS